MVRDFATGRIRGVTGDIDPQDLGTTNYHEHLFQVSPLLPGDEIDDESLSTIEAGFLQKSGFDSMVDATPLGLGRNAAGMARISRSLGLNVIATTGRHREDHYPEGHWVRTFSQQQLADRLTGELLERLSDSNSTTPPTSSESSTPARAGVIKAGIGYWSISPFERETLVALGQAHHTTGAPVMIHLEYCSAAHEVLDLLESLFVAPSSVCLAHADRALDAGLHVELAQRGAYLGYDGMARTKTHSDEELLHLTERVIERGGRDRIVLGGDVARKSRYVSYGGMPGMQYLGERYLPRLRDTIGGENTDVLTKSNPARWLTWLNR